MIIIKLIFSVLSSLLILLGFLSWRFEFSLPYFAWFYYILAGAFLAGSVWYGKELAKILWIFSGIFLTIAIFQLLFIKSSTWHDLSIWVYMGLATGTVGGIYWFIGSDKRYGLYQANKTRSQRKVYCSKCDQYLGIAKDFDSPCPRCGSNRYR